MTDNSMGRGLTPFVFETKTVRVVERGGDPWFVAADACAALGLTNPSVSIQALDEDERAKFNLGRQGEATIITEGGLYTLILRCRDATTRGTVPHRFRKWVTGDVLPAIRRAGRYEGAASRGKRIDPDMSQIMRARETRLTFAGHMRVLKALGIANAHAVLAANQATKTQTGFDTLAALGVKHLPPDTDSAQINSTTLGQHLGGLSAQEANKRLVEYGYATAHRDAKGRLFYELTDKGRATGGRIVPTGKKHSDGAPVTQCVWSMATVEALRSDMHGKAQ